MSDILLDRETHDLVAGDYDLFLTTGVDLLRQRLKQRLLTIRGEWFLDVDIGLPWFQEFAQKGFDLDRVRAEFIRAIVETEDVAELVDFDLSLDRNNRLLTVRFRVTSPFGEIPLEVSL